MNYVQENNIYIIRRKAVPDDILLGPRRISLEEKLMAFPRNKFHGSRRRDYGYRGGYNQSALDKNMQKE